MVAGVITSVGLGIVAIYTIFIVGGVKLKYTEVRHYTDAGRLLTARFGYGFVGVMFVLLLVLLVGSHCLTGTIAFPQHHLQRRLLANLRHRIGRHPAASGTASVLRR